MSEPVLIDDGGIECPNCGKNVPCIQYNGGGKKSDLPCRDCNSEAFMKEFRSLFNKVVDN